MEQREKMIESLSNLKGFLEKTEIPPAILAAAQHENPWFTAYYIKTALTNILAWLDAETLREFLADYPLPNALPKKVGIIAAGNVPFVGFHDVLMGVLSGNHLLLKLSHQDKVLMQWLIKTWAIFFSEITNIVTFVEKVTFCDFLISTGSDNTANQMEVQYPHIPKLIRRHRFSVAVFEQEPSEAEVKQLVEDILLYNGLGCRNVSIILTLSQKYLNGLKLAIKNYPKEKLNPHYQEVVKFQLAKLTLLAEPFEYLENAIFQPFSLTQSAQMGILGFHCFEDTEQLSAYLIEKKDKIQCIVGKNRIFPKTQHPILRDFSDGIDTLALLLNLNVK
ncbi:MAG: acyl-CoA reductase [Bacteroidia bacterium]